MEYSVAEHLRRKMQENNLGKELGLGALSMATLPSATDRASCVACPGLSASLSPSALATWRSSVCGSSVTSLPSWRNQ